jgi:hypothetical protein
MYAYAYDPLQSEGGRGCDTGWIGAHAIACNVVLFTSILNVYFKMNSNIKGANKGLKQDMYFCGPKGGAKFLSSPINCLAWSGSLIHRQRNGHAWLRRTQFLGPDTDSSMVFADDMRDGERLVRVRHRSRYLARENPNQNS